MSERESVVLKRKLSWFNPPYALLHAVCQYMMRGIQNIVLSTKKENDHFKFLFYWEKFGLGLTSCTFILHYTDIRN